MLRLESACLIAPEDPGLYHDEPNYHSFIDLVVRDCPDGQFGIIIGPCMEETEKSRLIAELRKHPRVFHFNSSSPGSATSLRHTINTRDVSQLLSRPYRVSSSVPNIIQKQVAIMPVKNIIQSSSSPWSSPVVLVRKRYVTRRFCFDYRRHNKIAGKDVYPIPRIDDTLDCIHGSRYISSMDLQSGY